MDKDPKQTESLLQHHQVISCGVIVDNCASRHVSTSGEPGAQYIKVGNKIVSMEFDGWKCYYNIEKPTADDLLKFEIIELTPRLSYEPQRLYFRREATISTGEIEAWRPKLGFPTYTMTKTTLSRTIQMVQTLQTESREYM